jgi:nucleoid DNA-binding protein|tara:strand:- start:1127 stop:1345 length:219 start_codon:yes stop_codon:yes gene_type:complete
MARNKKEIVQLLATKHNLPLKTVTEIVEYQFKYVTKVMKQGNFDTVRLPYFGKFSVKQGRVDYIEKLKNAKK